VRVGLGLLGCLQVVADLQHGDLLLGLQHQVVRRVRAADAVEVLEDDRDDGLGAEIGEADGPVSVELRQV